MLIDSSIFELLVKRVRDYVVFVLDPGGTIMTWNAGGEQITGYTAEEIIGRHFSVFYPPESIKAGWPAQELHVAAREGHFEYQGWRVRKDGSRFWANVIMTALRDDNDQLLGFSKITRDLSARREEVELLRRSEERFRLLTEGVIDYAIFMLDEHGGITSWNPGAQRIHGYSREEITGRNLSHFYQPEDVDAGKPWEELALARRTGRAEEEGWRVRKNGERFWARVAVSTLYDGEGRMRGFATVTQDLSERQHARDLENAAQHVNEFIATSAHELRNPLAPIRSALQMMDRTLPTDPAYQSMRGIIDRQSANLARIVDDMLDLSRVTRGTLSIARRVIDLAEVVAQAVETARPGLEEAKHVLSVAVPPGRIYVNGDIGRLTQVVANLLINAVRFTPGGGTISLSGSTLGNEAILSLRDNGRGIAAAHLSSIFGMFTQGKEPLHRVGGGLGIGLALARSLVALHDGTLEARSEGEGKGSEFILRLPLAEQPAATVAHADPETIPPGRIVAQRVLVVDDNVDAARTIEALLLSLGHQTRVVHDGTRALQAAEEFRPHIVLLDVGLPGISGYDVAVRLRRNASWPLKIVAITGWGQESDKARSRESGFDQHLVKPVEESALLAIVGIGQNQTTLH